MNPALPAENQALAAQPRPREVPREIVDTPSACITDWTPRLPRASPAVSSGALPSTMPLMANALRRMRNAAAERTLIASQRWKVQW